MLDTHAHTQCFGDSGGVWRNGVEWIGVESKLQSDDDQEKITIAEWG